jgi:hypothetical protein
MPRYVIAGAVLLLVLLIGGIMLVVGGSNGANSNSQGPVGLAFTAYPQA